MGPIYTVMPIYLLNTTGNIFVTSGLIIMHEIFPSAKPAWSIHFMAVFLHCKPWRRLDENEYSCSMNPDGYQCGPFNPPVFELNLWDTHMIVRDVNK